jgi:hypothetical protein
MHLLHKLKGGKIPMVYNMELLVHHNQNATFQD